MYKAGKSWVTAMVTIAAVALFTNATTSVHADTVVNNTNNAATTEKVEDTQSYTEAARQSTTANTDSNQNTANTNANSNTSTDSSSNTQPQVASNGNQWTHFNGGWSYTDNQGNWVYNQWQRINNNWYYFNNGGYAQTGWFRSGAGNWYYFDNNNAWADTGWQYINNNWYYFDKDNAWALTGWQKLNNKWYYFDNNNAWALRGWQHINNSWYYFDWNNAWALTDWQRINNNWYYFDDNNAWALTGWHKLNNKWYYFDYNNAWALKGWQRINNSWYYFDWNNSWALTGWQKLNNKWYYFDPNNAWMLTGSQYINGATEYFLPSGEWDKWHFVKEAQNSLTNASTNADNDVNTKQSAFNSAKTKLNNAGTDVPGNGDNSSNGSLRLDDQFNNLYNNYQSKLTQTANAGNWNEHNKVADEMDTATHNLMNQWNKNVTNQYLDDNTKIPASHTLTSLNDSYQSDPALRRILTKIGYQAQYDWKPSDPNNLHSQWIKTAIYNEDNRGLSINASINATNYLLELINPLRQARGLKPLSTNMSAIQNASQAVTKIVKLPELSAGASANSQASMEQRYNQIQQLKDQYNFTNYDQDSNHIRELTGSQNGYGAMVDISSLPDHGWVSIDNLHRALFAYAKNQANGEDNSIMGDKDFLLSATQSAVAVQIGEDDNIYVFLSTPVSNTSANTTAL